MQYPLRIFARELLRHWLALMSSAAFTFLGIYAALLNKDNAWLVWSSAVFGAAFFILAAYQTWNDEHKNRLRAEHERDELNIPKVWGFIKGSSSSLSGTTDSLVTVWGQLLNQGTDSILFGWQMMVQLPDSRRIQGEFVGMPTQSVGVLPGIEFPMTSYWPRMTSGNPIKKGGGAEGWILCLLRGIRPEEIWKEGTIVFVSCKDVANSTVLIEYQIPVASSILPERIDRIPYGEARVSRRKKGKR